MKQCDNCGKEIQDDALVCDSCGAEFKDTSTDITEMEDAQQANNVVDEVSEEAQNLEETRGDDTGSGESDNFEDDETNSEDAEDNSAEPSIASDDSHLDDLPPNLGPEPEDGEYKSKSKVFAGIVAIILVVIVVSGALFLFFKKDKNKKLSSPIIYTQGEDTVKLYSEKLKNPITISQEPVNVATQNGQFVVDNSHTKVSYISDNQDLFIVPIEEGKEATKENSEQYKIDTGVVNIFNYTEDGKYLAYINNSNDIIVYNGTDKVTVDTGVAEAMLIDNKYLIYVKVDPIMQTASLSKWKLDTSPEKAELITDNLMAYYLTMDKNDNTTDEVVYVAHDALGENYSVHSYNLSSSKVIDVEENARIGILISLGKGGDVLYSELITEDDDNEALNPEQSNDEAPTIERSETDKSDDSTSPTEIPDEEVLDVKEYQDIYRSKGGKKDLLATHVEDVYVYDSKNKAIVYRQYLDGEYKLVYHQVGKDPQVLKSSAEKDALNVILDEKFENLVVLVYDNLENAQEVLSADRYIIKNGKIGEPIPLEKDTVFIHNHTVGTNMIFFTKDDSINMETVDMKINDGASNKQIDDNVSVYSIISNYNYTEDLPFLYMKDVDTSSKIITGTLKSFDGNEPKEISQNVWAGASMNMPVFYQGESRIVYVKDVKEENMAGDLYAYNTSTGEEILLDSDVTNVF